MAYENDQSLYYAKQVPMEEPVTYAGNEDSVKEVPSSQNCILGI